MQFKKLDISDEFHVYRFRHGIKLLRPNARNKRHNHGWNTNQTVSGLLTIPCSIYFDNANGVIQKVNERNSALCGFDTANQAMGKPYFSSFTTKAARLLLENDHEVMKNENIHIVEEIIQKNNTDLATQVLSIKMPWYNNQNKVIGLFGCSVILGKDSLASSLALISKMGLLVSKEHLSANIGFEINGIYLAKQQRICAEFLLMGMSIKEIALRMNLSPRTVENYIENIKFKCGSHNRTDLIIKLYELLKHTNIN